MKKNLVLLFLSVIIGLSSCSPSQDDNIRQCTSFNNGWTFHLGDVEGAEGLSYDDSGWRKLNLPHDWAVEGDFSKDNPSGTGGGALPGGIGWYRKSFVENHAETAFFVVVDDENDGTSKVIIVHKRFR